jgi:hypothetical protein
MQNQVRSKQHSVDGQHLAILEKHNSLLQRIVHPCEIQPSQPWLRRSIKQEENPRL